MSALHGGAGVGELTANQSDLVGERAQTLGADPRVGKVSSWRAEGVARVWPGCGEGGVEVSEGLVGLSCFACLEVGMASHQALLLGSQGLHLELGRHTALSTQHPGYSLMSGLKLALWL